MRHIYLKGPHNNSRVLRTDGQGKGCCFLKRKVYAVGKIRLKKVIMPIFMAAVIGVGFLCGDYLLPVFEGISVFSAGLALPEGGAQLFEDQKEEEEEKASSAKGNSSAPPAAKVPETQSEEDSDEENENLAYTPDDIAKLIKAAQEKSGSLSNDGKISEYQYGKANATDVYENIWVSNKTAEHDIDIAAELKKEVDLKIENKSDPVVLIFHTHTTEAYQTLDLGWYSNSVVTRSNDSATNMVRVGDEIAEQLEEAGIGVIHDTTIHDTTYSGAYARSEAQIEKYMEEYPSLQVLLDIHRDAIKNPDTGVMTKPTAEINGKKAAQIMIVSGCEDGGVTGFPDWEYNLRFALNLQKECEDKYPGLVRPLFFCSRQYNMHKSHCSLLIEMGSDANTLDEAAYSGRLLGDALASLLERYVV